MTKTILITGATTGIGKDTALYFAERGWNVYATGRSIKRIANLEEKGIHVLYIDVHKAETMDAVLEKVTANGDKIDVLLNNAGYAQFGSIEDVPVDRARNQFETNLFGLAEMCRKVIPLMREQGEGRIINLTSIAGKISMPGGGWYASSKYAVEAISDALRWELKPFNIKVSIIEPGPIASNFAKTANAETDVLPNDSLYNHFYGFIRNFDNLSSIGGTGEDCAKAIWKAATRKRPRIRYKVTFAAKMLGFLIWLLPDRILDVVVVKYFSRS